MSTRTVDNWYSLAGPTEEKLLVLQISSIHAPLTLYQPAAQSQQLVAPCISLRVPAEHFTHSVTPPVEYLPGAQR